jgi:hypothetical protein
MNLHLFIDFDGTISLNDVGDERIDPSGAGVASRGRMGGVTVRASRALLAVVDGGPVGGSDACHCFRASCKRDVIRRVCG